MYDYFAQTGVEPLALLNRPDLPDYLLEYINAFDLLTTRRSVGLAVNPISLSEIAKYIEIFGCTEPDVFFLHIIKMDLEFMKMVTESKDEK